MSTKPAIILRLEEGHCFRKLCLAISNHYAFDWFILACIILNTVLLTIKWYDMPHEAESTIKLLNFIFTAIFVVEATIKITAIKKAYFKDNWNVFDFVIVTCSVLGFLFEQVIELNFGSQTTLVRAIRVLRVLRIIKRAKVLKIIIDTLIVTLPSLLNVGGLLLLIVYIYATLGVNLFADIKLQTNFNEQANFINFGRAFLTLVRASTGEAWDTIMYDIMRKKSISNYCVEGPTYEDYMANDFKPIGCGSDLAKVYFFSFSIVVTLIFLNLFVAIILQGFEDMNKKENQILNDKNVEHFRSCWSQFDPEGNGFMMTKEFVPFLTALGEPLGFNDAQKQPGRA